MRFRRPPWIASIALTATAALLAATCSASLHAAPRAQQSAAAPDDKLCTVSGNVVSANTGEPLRRAHVDLTLHDDDDAVPYRATTDAAGHFSLEHIPDGGYDLNVERDGYRNASYGQMHASQAGAVLTLKPGQKMTDLLFRLAKLAAVTGRVVDPDGDPLQHVELSLVLANSSRAKAMRTEFQAITNDLGDYRIYNVLPGRYVLCATPEENRFSEGKAPAPEFQRVCYPANIDRARASVVELKSGDELTGMDITLAPASGAHIYKIHGRVVDNTNPKGEHSRLVVLIPKSPGASMSADQRYGEADDKTGTFELAEVTPGDYIIVAISQGGGIRHEAAQKVTVTDSDIENVTLVLTKGAEMVVRVTTEGKAAASATGLHPWLRAYDEEPQNGWYSQIWQGDLQQDGSFLWAGVEDGTYKVEVASDCNACYVKAADASGIDVLARGVQVNEGAGPQRVDILYSSESGTVTGTVTNKDELPAAGATVVAIPLSPLRMQRREYKTAATDQYGKFEVKGLAPGEYTVYAFDESESDTWTDGDSLKRYEGKGAAVDVAANDHKSVELKLIVTNDPAN
jgi:hypothetical protein